MPSVDCGFPNVQSGNGGRLLTALGPTLLVDIGFDPTFKIRDNVIPISGAKNVKALVDTGAGESCIDAMLAQNIGLPIINQMPIAGVGGVHEVDIHLAQIHVPSLKFTIYGEFAAVNLSAGGQHHQALIGRTFLQHCTMEYHGKTGSVILSKA